MGRGAAPAPSVYHLKHAGCMRVCCAAAPEPCCYPAASVLRHTWHLAAQRRAELCPLIDNRIADHQPWFHHQASH